MKSILLKLLPYSLIILALMFCASSALAQTPTPTPTTTWTANGAGLWHTSANWDHGEPNLTTAAQINNGGEAQIYTDFPMANALSLTLGLNAGDSGKVTVSAGFGDLDVVEAIFVGKGGAGNFTITQGVVNSASASIASLTNGVSPSHGVAIVDGLARKWAITGNCDVGGYNGVSGGIALLSVTNGGTVTAGNVHVYSSGTLTNGTVTTTNGTTVDGTVSPYGGGGTLTLGGDLTLNASATTQCNVTPQDAATTPQVSISGQVSLGGRLAVTMTGDFSSAPTRYTLLHANSVDIAHPKFGSYSIMYPTGNGWTPQVSYVGNDVYLDRVYGLGP